MSRHAQIEEVSDSDSDPPEMDLSDLGPNQTMMPIRPSASSGAAPSALSPASIGAPQPQSFPANSSFTVPPSGGAPPNYERYKRWSCMYPVYFDASRSRIEGRRVSRELAVQNPLASEIAEAARTLGLSTFFEPGKSHPKDWANVGRVKVLLKEESGKMVKNSRVKNKHHLYILVSEYLRAHPTTQQMQLKVPVPGLPTRAVPPPHVPRGWKMGSILPLHSPAVTGGGVSENLFKEMMQDMQDMKGEGAGGGLATAAAAASSAENEGKKKKKDKKKGRS